MTDILVTGASGFVGLAVCQEAVARGLRVRAAARATPPTPFVDEIACVESPALDANADWTSALAGCHAVVHAAARVHIMSDTATDPLAEFRRVNVLGTLSLARQAAQAGVRRFVFVSSVKVHGEATSPDRPFSAHDAPEPQDPYGISKLEAEQGLRQIEAETGMQVAIVRPPLVYGPGVKANFASLLRWLQRGRPLPLGAVRDNRRSLVALDNLVDLLLTCVDHPNAAGETFLVSDGEDLSTTALLERMGQALNRPARLLPVPPGWLRLGAKLLGKADVAQRLLGSLHVDIRATQDTLGWTPPVSVDEGLRRTVAGMTS